MATDSTSCRDLVDVRKNAALLDRDRLRKWRREQANVHHYSTIWTKDPHGGPYRPVQARPGEDAIVPEPGYERVEIGPTTNIVGNHMTQAAIDLVRAELETQSDAPRDLIGGDCIHKTHSAACIDRRAAPIERLPRSIERYGWYDSGAHIKVEIPLDTSVAETQCTCTPHSVKICLQTREGDTHVLHLCPLAADIKEGTCVSHIRGRKVFVTFQKTSDVPWTRLCREKRHSAPKQKTSDYLQRTETARKQLLFPRRSNADSSEVLMYQQEPFAIPLEKVTAQVREEDLDTVHRLSQEGIQHIRLGDHCAAHRLLGAAVEEVLRIASKPLPTAVDDAFSLADQQEPKDCRAARFVPPFQLFLIAADLHHRLAKCCSQLGRLKEAIQLCTTSLVEIQTSRSDVADLIVEVLLTRATALESLERYIEAHSDFKEILVHRPNRMAADGIRRVQRLQLAQIRR